MDYIWIDKKKCLKIKKKLYQAGDKIPAKDIDKDRLNILIEKGRVAKTFSDDNDLKKENESLKKEIASLGKNDNKDVDKLLKKIEKLEKENEELRKLNDATIKGNDNGNSTGEQNRLHRKKKI